MAEILVLVESKQKNRGDEAVYNRLKDLLYSDPKSVKVKRIGSEGGIDRLFSPDKIGPHYKRHSPNKIVLIADRKGLLDEKEPHSSRMARVSHVLNLKKSWNYCKICLVIIEEDLENLMRRITPPGTRIIKGLIGEREADKIDPDLARRDPSVQKYIETLGCKCEGFEQLKTLLAVDQK
jgi:hypothetical protein